MDSETTRRAVLSAVLGAGVGGMALTDARSYLRRFAPGSGSVWGAATENAPDELSSPYGPATVRYDDYHVPHVEADSERAAYYAAGYCHGADRFFQLDLYRRLLTGHLSEVVGASTVESDAFHRQMDFEAAAAATWDRVQGTGTGDVVEAYVEGVNHAREAEPTPLEYRLLEFDPQPWTPTASLLISKQISWGLTGSFRTLRRALARDRLGAAATERLYPRIMDHGTPILRGGDPSASMADADAATPDSGLVSWLAEFESDPGIGSNSWVVSGEHTASGDPIVANDPHLQLSVPPVWYEQHVVAPEFDARGVAFPGVPFVVIGQNHAGAWGFTNAGADVIDFYAYETVDGGDGYRYGNETREFDARTETIEVADGENVEIEVKRSVHGAVLTQYPDGDGFETADELGVAWTGLSATRTVEAVRELNHADGVDEAAAAIRKFDEPTQNFVYADDAGNTYYWVTGQIPIRTTDGEAVPGTRIFDGSAGEGEWGDGYTPYGESSWDGFLSHGEKPGVRNPDYLATANQRITNDPEHYLSEGYAPPFRGRRIYDRLDARAGSDEPMDAAFHRDLQLDVVDGRYDLFRPIIEDAVEAGVAGDDDLDAPTAESLLDWDGEMRPDAAEPLLFDQWLRDFRERTFGETFDDAGLPDGFPRPNFWVLGNLPPDSEWFDGDRGAAAADAMAKARGRVDAEGWATYGDWNRVRFTHPFDQPFLNYDHLRTAGSAGTIRNFHSEASTGASWRMVATFEGDSRAILPGGNSGDYFSAHYDDQLSLWAEGEYKSMERAVPDGVDIEFAEGER
ncbi:MULTISPECIES: penicillin acylase family protein [Halolamina]|uniref:Penicillin amidase n=1 Tax=Halolamina pelagica TaxID=699431 RepID=A0A1I5M9I2_9EURY|nr:MULTISPECIES: penicillin acylase family protein [Halolamina]NHX35926.1 penicillin acylase family protein [Halolamina sp. R1-12]SFP06170.1 penicillin amidase [Halolamina pelagica]